MWVGVGKPVVAVWKRFFSRLGGSGESKVFFNKPLKSKDACSCFNKFLKREEQSTFGTAPIRRSTLPEHDLAAEHGFGAEDNSHGHVSEAEGAVVGTSGFDGSCAAAGWCFEAGGAQVEDAAVGTCGFDGRG